MPKLHPLKNFPKVIIQADKLLNSPQTVSLSAMYSYRRPIAIIAIRLI